VQRVKDVSGYFFSFCHARMRRKMTTKKKKPKWSNLDDTRGTMLPLFYGLIPDTIPSRDVDGSSFLWSPLPIPWNI
jgi:hypothetical protein